MKTKTTYPRTGRTTEYMVCELDAYGDCVGVNAYKTLKEAREALVRFRGIDGGTYEIEKVQQVVRYEDPFNWKILSTSATTVGEI